jgi:hypothetical protein
MRLKMRSPQERQYEATETLRYLAGPDTLLGSNLDGEPLPARPAGLNAAAPPARDQALDTEAPAAQPDRIMTPPRR